METSKHHLGFDRRVSNNITYNAARLARIGAVPGMEAADYAQDLLADLLHRERHFNPKLASFPTFADRIFRNRICTITAPTLRLKAEQSAVSLDTPVVGEDGDEQTFCDLLADQTAPTEVAIGLKLDLARFLAGRAAEQLDCCGILLAESMVTGARAAGLSRSTAYERAARLRQEASAHGLSIYVSDAPDISATASVSDGNQPGATARAWEPARSSETNMSSQSPIFGLAVTESELGQWLHSAEPGASLEYYRGYLAMDVQSERLPHQHRIELDRVARRARVACDDGSVHLLQRKNGSGDYTYIATASGRHLQSAAAPEMAVPK